MYSLAKTIRPDEPVIQRIDRLSNGFNPFVIPYSREASELGNETEYDSPETTIYSVRDAALYRDMPTLRQAVVEASQALMAACDEKFIEKEGYDKCMKAVAYRDSLERFKKEDIAYKKRVADELRISRETIDEWLKGLWDKT